MLRTTGIILLLSSVAGLPVAFPASATPTEEVNERSGIVDILVTARRKEERLQDAPVSVRAFTADEIAQRGAVNLSDLIAATPNLILDSRTNGADFRPAVRGISSPLFDPYRNRAVLGFFIDGVPVIANLQTLPLGDVERLEIIRGPQSALYGRATYAGAINFVPRRPGSELSGLVEVFAATRDTYRALATVSGPTGIDGLGFRAGGSWYQYGGQHRNRFSGRIYGAEENFSGNLGLDFAPSDDLEVRFNYFYVGDRNGPGAYGQFPSRYKNQNCLQRAARPPIPAPRIPGVFDEIGWVCGKLDARDLVINIRDDDLGPKGPGFDQDTHIATGSLTFERGPIRFVANTAWNWQQYEQRSNQSRVVSSVFDTPALPTGSQAIDLGTFESFSQELRFLSTNSDGLRWSVGVNYYRESFDLERLKGAQSLAYPDRDVATNIAGFGSLAYTLGPVTLTAEGRMQEDQILRRDTQQVGATGQRVLREKVRFSRFLPRVTLEWRVAPDVNLYGSYSEGARPGATSLASDTGEPVREERTINWEAGVRSTWLDRRLVANLTVFHIDWKDIFGESAREAVPGDPTTLRVFRQNQGDARIRGLELTLIARPVPVLTLEGNYAYLDAAYRPGFVTREAFDLLGQDSRDFLVGNRPRYIPAHSGTVSVVLADQLASGFGWRLRGDLNYTGDRYGTELNTDRFGAQTLVNLAAAVTFDRFEIEAWGRNVLNDRTILASGRFLNLDATPGARLPASRSANFIAEGTLPRGPQAGVTARARF
ncbi:TonB-dependent receptor [Thermaurantiacus tibetensis]|uniref:TonB-dependent receptor n=1 Tax=Thermaurantiacus tibetensis TaxID=2759035 RepID=UPI00188FDF52|nr:TonB-dependent receptor [Thermaurantiacus tibetensis]